MPTDHTHPSRERAGGTGALAGTLAWVLLLGACSSNVESGASASGGGAQANGGTESGTQALANGLPPELVSAECRTAGTEPGASPIRRLTRHEYNNTVHDLLGDASSPANGFTDEEVGLGYTNNADVQTASDLLIEQYEAAAIALAAGAIAPGSLSGALPCDPSAVGQDVCARTFIEQFGMKAYRRPLEGEEVERLFEFYATSSLSHGFETGLSMTMQAMLQSPHFLYRVETGPRAGTGAGVSADSVIPYVQRATGYELAVRLAYLLWSSMPDDALFQAARSGALDTPAGVTEQAQRMLVDPKINRSVSKFFAEWLELDTLGRVVRDSTLFPAFTPEVKKLMRTETELFTTDVVFGGGGDLRSLLLGSHSFMNKALADYYGVSGPSGEAFERVELDPARSAGLLTQGSLMAGHANTNQTSPVARGFFVRERFLCSPPPPPPPSLNIQPPAFDPNVSTRERFTLHRADPTCAGCHQLMDPIGLGLENFDAAGRYRALDAGQPIDASGEVFGTDDVNGPFVGAVELSGKLAASAMTRACLVRQWFRYGYGRGESELDACTLDALNKGFAASDGNVRDLLIRLVQTDAFLYRTRETGASL